MRDAVSRESVPFPISIYGNVKCVVALTRRPPRGELDAQVERALRRGLLWDDVKDRLSRDIRWSFQMASSNFCQSPA